MMQNQQEAVSEYFEEIIQVIDFSSMDQFLNDHLRTKMDFDELVYLISTKGLDAISGDNILAFLNDSFWYEVSIAKPIFIKMLCFSLLFSVVYKLLVSKNKYISEVGFLSVYVSLMVLLIQSFELVKEIALGGIQQVLSFLNALIPTYTVTLVFSGNAVSAAMLYEIAFLIIYLIELFIRNMLSPLIHVFILLLFLNHMFEEDKLSKLATFIEKIIQIVLKGSFGLVIGLGVVQSMITTAKDRLSENILLSGMSQIPAIGNAIGATGEIILSCGMLIKNSVGVIGLLILVIIAVIPLIKMSCFWLMYQGLSIILQPVADKRMIECISGVIRGCDLYFKMIMYTMLMFFVLVSMVTIATSFVF